VELENLQIKTNFFTELIKIQKKIEREENASIVQF